MANTTQTAPAPWHSTAPLETAERLSTDVERGLDSAEALRRLARHGLNRLPQRPRRTRLRMFADQFSNLLVFILLAAAALAAAVGEAKDALAIIAIIVLNGTVGYLQERRAADALAALRRMTAPTARVRRDGRTHLIPAEELVPGDVAVLEAGDCVPADLRLMRTSGLRTMEAALTGESERLDKDADAIAPEDAPVGERPGMALMGTTVVAGTGEGIVTATGSATEFGRIAALVQAAPEEETPLQTRLRIFGKWLVLASGIVVALVFLLGVVRGIPLIEMLLTSASLAVAAVPEGLPAVVTIALALGVARMARRRAIVRRLASVETLGCTTVICADKTGTLTTGRMAVAAIEGDPERTLHAAVACSTARLVGTEVAGDPTEGAILLAARERGITPERMDAEEPVVSIQPFDAKRKRMSIARRDRIYVKGAPESVLPLCVAVPSHVAAANDAMARRGLRVLAVATKQEGGDPEAGLTYVGLVGLHDPPRPEARSAVEACRAAGIRPVMITGDHPRTALAIARALGIADRDADVTTVPSREASVYARVSPEDKLAIVRVWMRQGAVVAMTGDGVNDAPALQGAHIGIAMGSGTDVAKDASAMIIMDDNFATIVSAVEEGRAIFENIRKALLYLLSGNTAEILVMAVAILAGYPLPLLPIQLLWINLVTDSLPALALATDAPERDLLRRPPRPPGAEIADRAFVGWLAGGGLLAAAVTLAAFFYGLLESVDKARTLAFSTLVIEEVLRAFAFRSRTRTLWEIGALSNMRLLVVVAATVGLQFYSHHSPSLQGFLKTGALTWVETLGVLALAAVPVSVLEIWKLVRRRLGPGYKGPK